jgi:hypothetical protein
MRAMDARKGVRSCCLQRVQRPARLLRGSCRVCSVAAAGAVAQPSVATEWLRRMVAKHSCGGAYQYLDEEGVIVLP